MVIPDCSLLVTTFSRLSERCTLSLPSLGQLVAAATEWALNAVAVNDIKQNQGLNYRAAENSPAISACPPDCLGNSWVSIGAGSVDPVGDTNRPEAILGEEGLGLELATDTSPAVLPPRAAVLAT